MTSETIISENVENKNYATTGSEREMLQAKIKELESYDLVLTVK